MASWGYKTDNGPAQWHIGYPVAKTGTRQSPVDIVSASAVRDDLIKELKYEYSPAMIKMINTGSSWKMDFSPEGSSLSGGPLGNEYKILQMHAHWGDKAGCGSEHRLDGKMFDAELHIVHYNSKYGDPNIALDKPDGLAVLGMFIKTGAPHPEFEVLCQNLNDIQTKNALLELEVTLDPTNCLPDSKSYFTYPGSLTTPPLFESVTWVVFKDPIEMSKEQLDTMRALKIGDNKDCDCMVNNYRPPCHLGDRVIRVKDME